MDAIGRLLLTAAAVALAACAPVPREGSYANPVLARDFPDPAVLRAPDGYYYAYATQSMGPPTFNIQAARSRNLVDWEFLGEMLPHKPAWSRAKQDFWAPHVLYDAALATYFMYYSAEPDAQRGKCLAVATSARPGGPFADSGQPLLCGEGFEHIDPMAFDDPRTGRRLLYWGSGMRPIRARELAAGRTGFAEGSRAVELIEPGPAAGRAAFVEAAWITYREPHCYLYFSTGLCCGPQAQYSIRVARAASALGPFEIFPAPIVAGNAAWRAPGHNSVAVDARGGEWLLYHGMARGESSARWMLLDRIAYRDGWPRVEADQPSAEPRPVPQAAP